MYMRALLPASVFVALLVASPAQAQDPKDPPPDEPVPTMTTDDVPSVPVAPVETQSPGTPPPDEGMTAEERADAAASEKADGEAPSAGGTASSGKKTSAAELEWRKNYASADEAAKAAERRAIEAELRVNELKNNLANSSSVAERNADAAALEEQGQEVIRARAEAAAARERADRLASAGERGKYRPEAGPAAVTKDGAVNPSYYAQALQKANSAVADADRRVELFQSRIVELRGQVLNTTGSGDNFAVMKIQEQLTQAEADLVQAQIDREAAGAALENAQNEARKAGVRLP